MNKVFLSEDFKFSNKIKVVEKRKFGHNKKMKKIKVIKTEKDYQKKKKLKIKMNLYMMKKGKGL